MARTARRRIRGVAWRQWLTVLVGAAVVAAMVVVADTARRDAERHRQAQVLTERVRAESQALVSINWQGLGMVAAGGNPKTVVRRQILGSGLTAWSALSTALTALHRIDPGPAADRLRRGASAIYATGIRALAASDKGDFKQVRALDDAVLGPQMAALDAYAEQAAAAQERIARRASERAGELYHGSLAVGLTLLFLLGWRLHRQRRETTLADAQRALERRGEERLRALVEHAGDVITVLDRDLIVRWQSPSVATLLGQDPEHSVGRRLVDLVHPEDACEVERLLAASGARAGVTTLSARVRHAQGDWRHLEATADNRLRDPAVQGIVLSMRDVTARQALENELRHQAFHDSLTGLANRGLFEDHLIQALARARRRHGPVAVLFLDLDDFKTINDSLGHEAGDELLRGVALRIGGVVRAHDTAARLGGDEFAVLAEALDGEPNARVIAERLLHAVAEPFTIAGRELRVGVSIGLAWSDGSIGVKEIMRDADTAMYAAKDAGKNTIRGFEAGMHRRVLDRLELTAELQRAVEQKQFELEYQPVVDLATGRITGAEALVRWAHPERGRVAPGDFIALAEETGLIVPLGEWILRTACERAFRWIDAMPGRPFRIGVNVSTRQLNDPQFPDLVADVLASTGVEPESLVLEITESLLPDDNAAMIERLRRLKSLGVLIAVDDFGTGYSALSRLHHFPIDMVKIDRSFITGIEGDRNKAQLVRGIVSLAESLDLEVVAEGLEHPVHVEQLREMRADRGQGFVFSPPVAPERLWELLQNPDMLALAT